MRPAEAELRVVSGGRADPARDLSTLADQADAGIAQAKRIRRLRLSMPRLERLCQPSSERFWVLGGRPGAYKTSLAWSLALNMARMGARVLVVSLEISPEDLSVMGLAHLSRLSTRRIRSAHEPDGVPFGEPDRAMFEAGMTAWIGLELRLRVHGGDPDGRRLADVLRSATRIGWDAVVVDHLGMIGRGVGRELDVLAESVDALRRLARGEVRRGYRPFVLATSQFNREIDKDDGEDGPRPPRMSDFRGSSRIEQDADVVIGLQKRARADQEGELVTVDAFVLKNRWGPAPAVIPLEANGPECRVVEHPVSAPTRTDTAPEGGGR